MFGFSVPSSSDTGCPMAEPHYCRGAAQLRFAGQPGAAVPTLGCSLPTLTSNLRLALQIGGQKAVEQLFSGFAAHRESAGAVGTRFQAALNVLADAKIFILHAIADVY